MSALSPVSRLFTAAAAAILVAGVAGQVGGQGVPCCTMTRAKGGGSPKRIVWVALEDAHQVAKVNVDTGNVLKRRTVNGRPHNLTISPTGKTVATALWDNARIAFVRRGRVKHIYLGGAPHDVKIDAGRVVVANQGAARLHMRTPRGKRIATIALSHDPHDLAIREDGKVAWVTMEGTGAMAVVNLEKQRVARYRPTGRAPHDLLFAPDGRLWVTDWHGAVHIFSRKGKRTKTLSLGEEAHHLDFTPNGKQVWITDHAVHRVFVVNTRTYRVLKRFPIKGAPHHVTITPDGKRAVVADHDRGLLVVYNVPKLHRLRKIRVGAGPHGVWASPRTSN